ncbi:DUF1203 domain-containing protein [Luteibacter aegosomatissinici]|uniref:DUF1203 domain-containing protein n=1 Tax=Luteibacter aegosomatissinici TaxID=2911539 RepID=UPI001FFA9475|nr:DUF1203 domain-containing protein [Luteibacter aegosomatissinici]UPG96453.1 DUF1203 domain-containing protein [Luteibacter aegosomatissinici]
MAYRIRGIDPTPFLSLYGRDEAELKQRGVLRMVAGDDTGYPERIELRNARRGESLLLLNFTHQPAAGPYHASHAVFVREGATEAAEMLDEVPEVMATRMISLRAFNAAHLIDHATLVDGRQLDDAIRRMLGTASVAYVHAHYAAYGCFAGYIDRA